MSKEKIKRVVADNYKKILAIFLMLITILLIVGMSVNANRNDDYAVEIKDSGEQNIATNNDYDEENPKIYDSSITKKIVADTPNSLTYEVQVRNLAPNIVPEVAIVIDSSRSMGINDIDNKVKQKAIQLVTELRTNSPKTKISISSNTGVKAWLTTQTPAQYTSIINAITFSDSESVTKAIDYATSTFSAGEKEKYLVIFSDATDSTKEKLEGLTTDRHLEIYSMLTDITNNEYETSSLMGTAQMISEHENYAKLWHRTNSSMVNVELADVFSSEIIEYFDFEEVSKDANLEMEKTSNGYILKCEEIKAGETKTYKFRLTLNEDVKIDAGKIYRELNTSDNLSIKYEDRDEEKHTYETKATPTLVICKKYSLTIKAVSEKSSDLPLENLAVKVVGTTVTGQDEEGNDIVKTILDETLTTDSKGRILIGDLKTLGDINFEIKPLVDRFGYQETSATQVIVHNDPTGVGTIWAESDVSEPDVDVVNRNITVVLPITVQTYDMEIETVDLTNSNIKLGNAEYRLIQPKLNSKYEMEALYGTTGKDGKLIFKPAVMTKDGSYQYILSQMNRVPDYDPIGNATLIVTFENGKVTKIAHQYNENVSTQLISDSKTKVTVGNASLQEDTFDFEINLSDELTGEKLFGGIYNILVSRTTPAGEPVSSLLSGYMTDENGKINIEIPGTGYINLKIVETSPKAGYVADPTEKEITFYRNNGTIQYITSKNPPTMDAIPDTDNNKIIVNFKSKVASEQNRIQVHLIDEQDQTANIPGVTLSLNKVGSKDLIYATTNREGIANFIIPNEDPGSYQYEIGLFSAVPKGYATPASTQLGVIAVTYDTTRYVVDAGAVSTNVPTMNVEFEQTTETGFIYDNAKVDLSLDVDPAYAYQLKINLLDGSNMRGLAGGKYSILMESDGVEVKYLSGKLTDNNGNYTTRIVGGGENITITIKETATLPGYILNTDTQVIELELTNTGYVVANSSPNIYNPAEGNYIGVTTSANGKEFVYHDINHSKTGENTVLNLHVNKMDTNDFLVAGIRVKLSSETLLRADGSPLDSMYNVLDEDGNVIGKRDYYVTDQNGYFEELAIKVKGDELNNGERIDYLYMNEIDEDGNIISNTDITFKITFRQNKNTYVVEVTNVEATWGNRLVKDKTYSSRETDVAYESDVYLDIFTNFDDVGNFSIDLKKVDKDGKKLPGAKYDIVVMRPDSTTLVRRDINVTDNVELDGILVSEGTIIEITEKEAPIGYNVNVYTEVIKITKVDSVTGLVECELEPSSYETPRASISNTEPLVSSDGRFKLCITLDLVDYEADTFKLGITAKDSTTGNGIKNYKFKAETTQGAQKHLEPTDENGNTSNLLGANYKIDDFEVTYKIDTLQAANYYKKLANPIEVKVIFDLNGAVKSEETTRANQGQAGFGTIWNIVATNTIDGNDIDLDINIDPCDPLTVNIQTQNIITGQNITNIAYRVTPSVNIPATGTTTMQVGYVAPNSVQTYKLNQTNGNSITDYGTMPEQEFKVQYDDDGKIIPNGTLANGDYIELVSASERVVNLRVKVLPVLLVNVQSVDAITNNAINSITYKITPSEKINALGNTTVKVGYVRRNAEAVQYTVEQTVVPDNYVKLANQGFTVDYDDQGKVVNAVSTTEKLEVLGANNNTVSVKVTVEPALPFVITNESYFGQEPLANATFEISLGEAKKDIRTNGEGIGINYLGELGNDNEVTYTVKQKTASIGYATVNDFQVKVKYDDQRNVIGTELLGDVNDFVDFIELTYTQPSTVTDLGYNGNDKGIINIKVKNYPEVQFTLENVDRTNEEIKLSGTKYTVESSTNIKAENIVTAADGKVIARLDRGGFETTIRYTIKEITQAARYQALVLDPIIEVDFDRQGFIKETRIVKMPEALEISRPEGESEADKLKLNIKVKNNPELKINITKVDEEDNTIVIPGVSFEVTARIDKNSLNEEERNKLTINTSTLTEENYLSEVLDRLKIDREDVENLRKNIGINNVIEELKNSNNLTPAQEEEINTQLNDNLRINKISELGKRTKTQINQTIARVTNRAIIDRLIEENKTSNDTVNDLLAKVKNLVRLDVDNVVTDAQGLAHTYMDKTLAGRTIEYTLKETRKAAGYDWLNEVVIIEITYDNDGKMVQDNPVRVVSGAIEITEVNQDGFEISTIVKNEPSKDVKIHLSVEDVYDPNKKLEVAKFDAYLVSTETEDKITYSPDNDFRVSLETGSVTSGTGLVTAHGEDTESMGVYDRGAGSRLLRLVQKQTPSSYYLGNDKFDSAYQSIQYALLVNVSFDDEGRVTDTSIHAPGTDTLYIGYVADGRYIKVTHTRNTINVTIKYYPMLQVQMQARDMYTKQSLSANYTVDTYLWGSGYQETSIVSAGYINPYFRPWWDGYQTYGYEYYGRAYSAKYTTSTGISSVEQAQRVAIGPTDADRFAENKNPNKNRKERTLYVYENAEPSSPIQYQTYLPRYVRTTQEYLLAVLKVKYDDMGQVEDVTVLQENSQTNIRSGFVATVKATVNEYTIGITVDYAPITTISTTVIDEVSGAPLSGIRVNPYLGGTDVTNTSYEYRSTLYYTTNHNGNTGWTYWGASKPDTLNRYILDTYTVGSGYESYFDPGNIILDVAYDENGRVSAVTPKSTDAFGDVNAINATWTNNNIHVTIKYSRKFNVKLNKVDYYDSNKRLNAVFSIISNTGLETSIPANTVRTLGKIYPGKTTRYTLSETTIPAGYYPVENMDIMVTFNNNGSIRAATAGTDHYQFVQSAPVDPGTSSLDKIDLEANIKDKPRFDLAIQLSDMFYPTVKLAGGTFTIESSKGDTAAGGVQTDGNGMIETFVGTVYRNEEVTYTIKQTNVIPGYYANNVIARFKVHFNANGKIDTYSLIEGSEVATIHPTAHVGTQKVKVNIANKPKDVKLGIYKKDQLDGAPLSDISFKLTTIETGKKDIVKDVVTNANGTVIDVVDTFKETTGANRVVTYKISEIQAAPSYRKIQDIEIKVTYKSDGSMYLYDVVSNPSNVGIEVATNAQIKYLDNTPIHIKLTIPNDNAYDLIVKNEDTNLPGLGIQGTIYDVIIDGVVQNPITTNADGIAKIANQTQTGEITIDIAERTIGEGYRADNNNFTTVKVEKGVEEYTLVYTSHTNETYATVEVNEEYGTITVTFKNETKLELTVQSNDINTGEVLEGTVFEIKEEELDNTGNVIEGTEKIITGETTNTTDENGILYFDLGLSKRNATVRYTFTQITPPVGYDKIFPITMTAEFNNYGHIIEMTDDSFRARETLASNTGKSHHMIVVIGNGTVNEAYSVKILKEDSQSGRRINDSLFEVEVVEESTGATNKSAKGYTQNLTSTLAGNNVIFERGAFETKGVTAEGDVKIKFREVEPATGYVVGQNPVSGIVTINAQFEVIESSQEKQVTLTEVDNSGFDVVIDNINREVIIKVKNDPDVTFEITKIDGDTKVAMPNVKFHVTSEVITNGAPVATDLDKDMPLTNENGFVSDSVKYAYAGKTVIYTLKEEKVEAYDELEDIILEVQYDPDGNIVNCNVLSNPDDITIKPNSEKTIRKQIIKETDIPGNVIIDYANIKVPTGIGTRILQMEINNHRTVIPRDYQIQIGKYHEDTTYPYLIAGAKYEITVRQQYGKEETTWTDITDEDGIILSPHFSGFGEIEVQIKEIESPEGYKLDTVPRTTRFIRYESSQKMVVISTDSGCTFNDDYTIVNLKAVDEVVGGLYDIVINKVDVRSGALIPDNPAKIKLEMEEEYQTITQDIDEETGEIVENVQTSTVRVPVIEDETDENGRLIASKIKTPSKPGQYKYILTELQAPEGYNPIAESEVEILVTFEENQDQEMIITNVVVTNAEDVRAAKTSNKVMSIIVYNGGDDYDDITLNENQFAIDLRKVDSELYQITTTSAEFKLTNLETMEEKQIITDELGRAEVLKLRMPSEPGKYKYKLEETKAPKGYKITEEPMYLLLEVLENEEGKLYINSVGTEGKNLVHANKPAENSLPNKIIKLQAINEDLPYTLVIEKHHEADPYYPQFISDVEFEIKVKPEFGEELETTKITDVNGIIRIEDLNGYGRIKVEIKELAGPDKYKKDFQVKYLEFYRDKSSKELREYDSNVHYDLKEDTQEVVLKPINELAEGLYDLVISKIDKTNNTVITNNPAQFSLYMINKYDAVGEDGVTTEVRVPIIENAATNNLGMLIPETMKMPTEPGTYTFELEEVTAPNGYEGLKEPVRYEMTVEANEIGEMMITDAKVLNNTDKVKLLSYKKQFISLSVANNNGIPDGSISIDLSKVNKEQRPIITDTSVFKVTDEQTGKVLNYIETVKGTGAGYAYISKPMAEGEYTYILNEIKAPEGYAVDRSDIKVKVKYEYNNEGGLDITNVEVDGENAIYQKPETGVEANRISLSVKNEVAQGGGSGNANDKPYTVIINKIDKVTKQNIRDRATFDVALVNGEIVHASTNEKGQMIIENVHMPSTEGEYEILVKETNAPEGYILDRDIKVVKVTFSGTDKDMIISNLALGENGNTNIEIVTAQCTEDKIVLNVINRSSNSEDDPLYVVSRRYEDGEDIYDVLKSFKGDDYSIDTPFIDTKVARYMKDITVQEFIDNLESNGTMTVLDKKGNELSPTARVKTGMTLRAVKGNEELRFTIVVKGDSSKDGRLTATDLNEFEKHVSGEKLITDPIKLRALDVVKKSGDGKIRATDLNQIYKLISNGELPD